MKHKTKFILLACAGLVFWLWRDVRDIRERGREQHRLHCLDNLCEGDTVPTGYDWRTEFPFKVNGQWFIGPKDYGGYGGSFAFFWPSKTPRHSKYALQNAPEFIPSAAGRASNFYEVAIEIFLRSYERVPNGPSQSWSQISQQAEAERRVISKTTPRAGLEVWRIIDEVFKKPVIWYVATDFRWANGDPPVLFCHDKDPKFDRCTTGFFWKPGIALDMRFRARHGIDWPDIYQETMRVLQLLKRV